MQILGAINKAVDKERTMFGLKGIFIILFVVCFMLNLLMYMILSSFFPPLLILVLAAIGIGICVFVLVYLNKTYGVHLVDTISFKTSYPKYLSRNSKTFNIK